MNRLKKIISLMTAIVLIITSVAIPQGKSNASPTGELAEIKDEILKGAVEFLKKDINEDGNFGDAKLINNTAEAAFVLRKYAEKESNKALDWIEKQDYSDNTDILARKAIAADDISILEEILKNQNKDGGFGLSEDYQSDILDSLLVLDAINSCSNSQNTGGAKSNKESISEYGIRLVNYIARSVKTDGSYSYSKYSDSDLMLTSMALYAVNSYMSNNNITSDLTTAMLDKTAKYITEKNDNNIGENNAEEKLWMLIALCNYKGVENLEIILNELKSIQKSDGSFYENDHYTMLAIRLLEEIDLHNVIKIYDFKMTNTDKAYYGVESSIKVQYAISYNASLNSSYEIKVTVTNGKEKIYESEKQTVELKTEENVITGSFDEFAINQNKDDGIVVTVSLYDGDELVKESTGSITLENQPRAGETEISDFIIELNQYYTYAGAPVDVNARYKLLYNTNVDNDVDIQISVLKDGKLISEDTYNEELLPSENGVTRECITFTPDVTKAGNYKIKAVCLYNGENVCEREENFIILDIPKQSSVPEDATPTDADKEKTSPDISWVGPYLSDYILYAGKETSIEAAFGINYYAEEDFAGTVITEVRQESSVNDGNEKKEPFAEDGIISRNETDILLSADDVSYKSDKILTFKVKDVGIYKVTVTLYDENGEKIKTGFSEVKVTDKKSIPFIANSNINSSEDKTVDINWNDISDVKESYNYRLYRRYDGTDWESRSIWNETDKIRVLNVYPIEPYLKTWMTETMSGLEQPAGMGMFDITSVHIREFNEAPVQYLYDENGEWSCDVIFFGSGDCNGCYDLSGSAQFYVQKFVDSGRGVLFGHDTISACWLNHTEFNKFAEQIGLRLYYQSDWFPTSYVSVKAIGTLTNFPWTLRGTLTISGTHSTGQYVGINTDTIEWMALDTYGRSDEDGYHDNFYLATKNNLGLIQTGGSEDGEATDDERKIFANTLFYLYQVSKVTTAKDNSFYDLSAPDVPEIEITGAEGNNITFNLNSKDNGTRYEYYVEAVPSSDNEGEKSNIMTENALSGIKGYVYRITDSAEPDSTLIEYDENNEAVQNLELANSDGSFKGQVEIPDFSKKQYIHVFAVDNENNVSNELIYPIDKSRMSTAVTTDKAEYTVGETVLISSTTTPLLYSSYGDVSIALYDGDGNYIKELEWQNIQEIDKSRPFELNKEWKIEEGYIGDFSIKIIWSNAGKELASGEVVFRVIAKTEPGKDNNDEKDTDKSSSEEISTKEESSEHDSEDKTEEDKYTSENTTKEADTTSENTTKEVDTTSENTTAENTTLENVISETVSTEFDVSSETSTDVKFHLRTRTDKPLLRTEYGTCNKHLLLTERNS